MFTPHEYFVAHLRRTSTRPAPRDSRRSIPVGQGLEPLEQRRLLSVNIDGLHDSTECGPFKTYSQGGYGGDPPTGAPAVYLSANFAAAFSGGLQIGDQTAGAATDGITTAGNRAALFTSAAAIGAFLPHGGTSSALAGDFLNPVDPPPPDPNLGGALAGQTVTMMLNVGFDLYDPAFAASSDHLVDMIVGTGPFAGKTVGEVIGIANQILAGTATSFTADEATAVLNSIVDEWHEGVNDDNDFQLLCPGEEFDPFDISGTKFVDANGDGSVAGDAAATTAFTVNLYTWADDGDNVIADSELTQIATTETSALDGTYVFTDLGPLAAGLQYVVKEAGEAGWTQTFGNDGHAVPAVSGGDSTGNDFGNFENLDIRGTKRVDVNGDHSIAGDPTATTAFTVNLYTWADNGDNVIAPGELTEIATTETSALDGTYAFTNLGPLAAGLKYVVKEAGETGWTQTFGNDGYAVPAVSGGDSTGNDFGNFENIDICGKKYKDHNGNGVKDGATDQVLANWTFILNDDGDAIAEPGERTAVSGADGVFCFYDVGPGKWTVTEAKPPANWLPTQGKDGYSGTATSGQDVKDLLFGNTEVGAEAGKTIGFWSNKNGQALLTAADFTALTALNLRNADGTARDFTGTLAQNKTAFNSWLLSATATNMSYMLSAQLAATQLNVLHGFYGSSTSIYIGGALTAWSGNSQGANLATNLDHDGDANNADADGNVNQFGIASIQGLINAANAELALHSKALSADAWRPYQEALKIAFDGMNNNLPIFLL